MESLYSIGTCLVIVINSIYFVFPIRVFCLCGYSISTLNSDLQVNNKHHLHSRPQSNEQMFKTSIASYFVYSSKGVVQA